MGKKYIDFDEFAKAAREGVVWDYCPFCGARMNLEDEVEEWVYL